MCSPSTDMCTQIVLLDFCAFALTRPRGALDATAGRKEHGFSLVCNSVLNRGTWLADRQ